MSFVEFSDVSGWLETCLPGDDLPDDVRSKVKPFDVALDSKEAGMYPGLCKGFNDLLAACGRDKSFVMKVTGSHEDTIAKGTAADGDENRGRPDLVMYQDTDEARKSFLLPDRPASSHVARTIWAHAELMVEAKHSSDLRPFSFEQSSDPLPDGTAHEDARGQILEYAREMCSRQHRCFAYIISVFRHRARLIRVDRTAALVSEPFDYVENPLPLATFIYRYANASPEERGFDPTATLASQDDADMFRKLPARYVNDPFLHSILQKAVTPGWPIFKLAITGRWSSDDQTVRKRSAVSTRFFLIGRPLFRSHSMTGRGTRGFAAYDVIRDTIVFIKDYWRAELADHLSEYDVYLELSNDGNNPCKFVPTLLGGGDVRMDRRDSTQKTLSGRFTTPLPVRVHVRLVMKEVCRRLQSFSDWRELVSVVRDALRAHQSAWEDHGILHRDLSVGNILIYEKPAVPKPEIIGLLSDWDLAKEKKFVLHPNASQPSRSGTWQFLSGALTIYRSKPHVLSDDLESVMHILNWLALKHLPNADTANRHLLAGRIMNIYDPPTPRYLGSSFKWQYVSEGFRFFLHKYPSTHPFIFLLDELTAICKTHYERLPVESLIEAAEKDTLESVCVDGIAAADGLPPLKPPLGTHSAILAAFDKALRQRDWPKLVKLDDQIPDHEPTSSSFTPVLT
ncbi:hypothetical protein C8Q73DRAFT_785869 [Cubamyces lactineus]|nr:hypothetical protein C8Q73DRAFT_785869 [Cubamyces lactineus]